MTKSLSKAIALATLVGVTASAQAVSVNPEGLGEVLLYSLYTAEEGNITNINITNTTNETKAVKVRFLEGQNSHEVLDFNLYLSPHDQWTGAVTLGANGGAELITADKSCTLPKIGLEKGVPFRDMEYLGDGGEQSIARTRVGHFEVIEMGDLNLGNKFKNISNAIANKDCGVLEAAFEKGGLWHDDATEGFRGQVTGGLYGTAEIMNVNESTVISYDALALEEFKVDGNLHVRPGTIYPNLNGNIASPEPGKAQSYSFTSNFARINGVDVEFPSTIQAISAVLAKADIHNNYVIDEGRASKSNWVITFPTKRFHVDASMENGLATVALSSYPAIKTAQTNVVNARNNLEDKKKDGTPAQVLSAQQLLVAAEKVLASLIPLYSDLGVDQIAPFTKFWEAGTACEDITISAWDNDERVKSNIDFSPSRPTGPQLCYETNIITYNGGKVLGGEFVTQDIELDPALFPYGWMNVDLVNYDTNPVRQRSIESLDRYVEVYGLPAIGFSAANFRNNSAKPGINNIYTSSSNHKATKSTND